MANRRKLKKAIKFVTTELITEIYILSFFKEVSEEKLDELVNKVVEMNDKFVPRVSHADGKKDSKIVKAYFKKLREDWTNAVKEIAEEAGKL